MASNIKKKRASRQYYAFLFACLASLLGLFIYLLGAKKIPFPHQWIPGINSGDEQMKALKATKLLLFGISIHLQVNIALQFFFILLNPEKMDRVKFQKWRFWISRTLIFLFSIVFGLAKYWSNVKGSWGSILLLSLIITVINCCLLELLIQLMNQYGICNAFNLILFTEFLPYDWIAENWTKPLPMICLTLITVFFIWIINLKWEAAVETNTLHNRDSKILKKNKSKLGFRLNMSFMPLIYLSQFTSYIYNVVLMRRAGVNWGSLENITNGWNAANGQRELKKIELERNPSLGSDSFSESFFLLNEGRYIFSGKKLGAWFWGKKWLILGALGLLLFLRWLVVWIQMRKINPWKTGEISKDLRSRGIYINYLAPGHSTRNLLKKIINKIIFFWYFIILVFNIIFDNIFKIFSPFLSFFSWFGSVNIGVDLVRQIRTKYKYIKTNK